MGDVAGYVLDRCAFAGGSWSSLLGQRGSDLPKWQVQGPRTVESKVSGSRGGCEVVLHGQHMAGLRVPLQEE